LREVQGLPLRLWVRLQGLPLRLWVRLQALPWPPVWRLPRWMALRAWVLLPLPARWRGEGSPSVAPWTG
jgi:hypothetical protein